MLVVQEHESCFQVRSVVVQHFIVIVQVVDEVTDEKQVVGLKRRKVAHRLHLFLCLNLLVPKLRRSVCLTVMACKRRLGDDGLISVFDCQGRTVESCISVGCCKLSISKPLSYLSVYNLSILVVLIGLLDCSLACLLI